MKKYLILPVLIIAGAIMSSCDNKAWDDHYNTDVAENENVSELNTYNYLASVDEYTEFVQLLDVTGVSAELNKSQLLTVWAVSNENIPDNLMSQYSEAELRRIAMHHVNYLAYPVNKLENLIFTRKVWLDMLSKKEVKLTELAGNTGLALDGRMINEGKQQLCANGVVQNIASLMIPRDNAMEVIAKLDDTYSILRDSILFYNDTIFDRDESYLLGYDDDGPIYDSVFKIQNKLLGSFYDLYDERLGDHGYTLMTFSNNVIIDGIIGILKDYTGMSDADIYDPVTGEWSYGALGEDFGKMAQETFLYWIMSSFLYADIPDPATPDVTFLSELGTEWRTNYQQLASTPPVRGSNCVVYDVAKVHIPRYTLSGDFNFNVPEYWSALKNMEGHENVIGPEEGKWLRYTAPGPVVDPLDPDNVLSLTSEPAIVEENGTWWKITQTPFDNTADSLWYEFTVLTSLNGIIQPAIFFPGEYYVYSAVNAPANLGSMDLWFNGEPVAEAEVIPLTTLVTDSWGGPASEQYFARVPMLIGESQPGVFTIDQAGPLVIRWEVRAASAGAIPQQKQIVMKGWQFRPVTRIY